MVLAAIAAALLGAQAPVKLVFSPPVGATYRYRLSRSMTMELGGKLDPKEHAGMRDLKVTNDLEVHVLKREAGITTLEEVAGPPKMSGSMATNVNAAGGQIPGNKFQSSIDGSCHVRSTVGPWSSSGGALTAIGFPTHALEIGATWTEPVDFGKFVGAVPGTASSAAHNVPFTFTLTGVEDRQGGRVAIVTLAGQSSAPVLIMGQSIAFHMDSQGTAVVDLGSGLFRETRLEANVTASNAAGKSMKQHLIQTLTRV